MLQPYEEQFACWAKSIGKSDKTIKNYTGALKGSIPNWLNDAGISQVNLMAIGSYIEFEKIIIQIREVAIFIERDRVGKGMYSAAIKSYRAFLADITDAEIQQDIDDIVLDNVLSVTEKSTLVKTRIGQGQFRNELIEHWQGCALTHYKQLQFLVASHIKPWRVSSNQERVNPFNGLLLLSNLDKAFDLGYITFKDKGQIAISEDLEDHELLGIRSDMSVKLSPKHQDFVAYHREQVFIR
jgi:hypothetical protein